MLHFVNLTIRLIAFLFVSALVLLTSSTQSHAATILYATGAGPGHSPVVNVTVAGDTRQGKATFQSGLSRLSLVNRIQRPISAPEINDSFVYDRRRPHRTHGEHSIKREHHVLVITKITRIDRFVVQTSIRLQHLQRILLRTFSLKIPHQFP